MIFEATNTKVPNIHEPGYFGTVCERGQTPSGRETLRQFVPTIADDRAPQKRLLAIFWFRFFNAMPDNM